MISHETSTEADYTDDLALLANTPTQSESLMHSLKQASKGSGLHELIQNRIHAF